MRQEQSSKGQSTEIQQIRSKGNEPRLDDFVLEKSIFNNIFEKDIRRVFIYKKAERLAKAIHLMTPAFAESASLRRRIDAIVIDLIDAALLPPSAARTALSRELLALSSVLSIARIGGLLSLMNTELVSREAHLLLQEVASYEEPRLSLDDAPTLSDIAKNVSLQGAREMPKGRIASTHSVSSRTAASTKGHIKDIGDIHNHIKDRREAILSVIRDKKKARIKDISTHIRTVSEKTIQRELLALIKAGVVLKEGERRWSAYSLR